MRLFSKIAVALIAGLVVIGGGALDAYAAEVPKLNFCTGRNTGNYYFAATQIAKQAAGAVAVEVLESKGSMDNLEQLLGGKCDAAIVQSDAYYVFKATNAKAELNLERAGVLYKEYVHLVCNEKSGITSVKDLKPNHTVAIDANGSGTQVTWAGFILVSGGEKSPYSKVSTIPIGGKRALEKVKDGTEATCLMYTAGLGSDFMKNDVNAAGGLVRLAKVGDGTFDDAKDQKGQRIYNFTNIPGGTYAKLQHGMLSSSVETLSVDAVLVVKNAWIDANDSAYDKLLSAKQRAEADIKKRVGQ